MNIHPEIGAALIGGFIGVLTGIAVSRLTVRYDRRLAACSAMQALAGEAHFNAHVVRHLGETPWDSSSSALERQAFDAALPVLHVLPPRLGDRSREARSNILIMMHVEELLESSEAKPEATRTAMLQKRQELIANLPLELESIADEIVAFVKTDCGSRWYWG